MPPKGKIPHVCGHCEQIFPTLSKLKQHVKIHRDDEIEESEPSEDEENLNLAALGNRIDLNNASKSPTTKTNATTITAPTTSPSSSSGTTIRKTTRQTSKNSSETEPPAITTTLIPLKTNSMTISSSEPIEPKEKTSGGKISEQGGKEMTQLKTYSAVKRSEKKTVNAPAGATVSITPSITLTPIAPVDPMVISLTTMEQDRQEIIITSIPGTSTPSTSADKNEDTSPVKRYKCVKCDRPFTTAGSHKRHESACKATAKIVPDDQDELMDSDEPPEPLDIDSEQSTTDDDESFLRNDLSLRTKIKGTFSKRINSLLKQAKQSTKATKSPKTPKATAVGNNSTKPSPKSAKTAVSKSPKEKTLKEKPPKEKLEGGTSGTLVKKAKPMKPKMDKERLERERLEKERLDRLYPRSTVPRKRRSKCRGCGEKFYKQEGCPRCNPEEYHTRVPPKKPPRKVDESIIKVKKAKKLKIAELVEKAASVVDDSLIPEGVPVELEEETCEECGEVFPDQDALIEHDCPNDEDEDEDEEDSGAEEMELDEAALASLTESCDTCGKRFTNKLSLLEHLSIHTHIERPIMCGICTKTFSRKYHLDRHKLLTSCSGGPPPSHICQVCGKAYTRKDNLREHLRAHAGEVLRRKKYKCEHCNKQFHGTSLLKIHIRTHTGEKPFNCDFCIKCFNSTGALTKHRRIHTGEKPYECIDCGVSFSLKGTLNRHMRIHTGVRPHKCEYCGKEFIQAGGLKAHMFYHTGENGFKCGECGKLFNRKARLQMHIRYVHEKVKPFKCNDCEKGFTRKEDLLRHAVLHSGEKNHQCPTCQKRFSIKPSLKLHMLTHTKEEPRSCHECGRAFIRKDCLLRHMRKRHRDLLNKILLDEKEAAINNPETPESVRILTEQNICDSIRELLSLLVDESTLKGFGWPDKPVDELLESVIKRCGHVPVNAEDYSYMDRLRENSKLLFTVVIDDNAVKTLLNNQTVDEVILHVLRLAKS